MSRILGNLIFVYIDGVKIARLTNCSLQMNLSLIPVRGSTDTHNRRFIGNKVSWSVTFRGIIEFGQNRLLPNQIINRRGVSIRFGQDDLTQGYWGGQAYLAGYSMDGAIYDPIKFQGTYAGSGELHYLEPGLNVSPGAIAITDIAPTIVIT